MLNKMATRSTRAKKNDEGDAHANLIVNEKHINGSEVDQENVEVNIIGKKKSSTKSKSRKNNVNQIKSEEKDSKEDDTVEKQEKNEETKKITEEKKLTVGRGKKTKKDDDIDSTNSTEITKSTKTRNKPKDTLKVIEQSEDKINDSDDINGKDSSENEMKAQAVNIKRKGKKGSAAKKEKKISSKDDEQNKEVAATYVEIKTRQSARDKRSANKTTNIEKKNDSTHATGEPPNKKMKKEDKPLKNKSSTAFDSINFANSSVNSQGSPWNFKISSWNVDGIRAWLSKGGLEYIKHEKPDILCLQEVKCSQEKLPKEATTIEGYHPYWLCSDKDGYAGVCIYTTKVPIDVQYGLKDEDLDSEGRIITAEYEQFYLICTYVPNAGRKLITLPKKLKWNELFHKFVKELDSKKPVIICGDMNVAHNEIDLTNPKTNKKNAGFTEEERAGMTALLNDGFVDTFRHLNPDRTGAYTFWTYMMNSRAKNVGWRLDYMVVSERLVPSLCDSVIRSEVFGSDHCPITLCLNLSTD